MVQALKQIQTAIKDGRLKPGDRLIETELANEMGISRFPIREALRQLEKEGLVQSIPFKGTTVAESQSRIFLNFEKFHYSDLSNFINWHVAILKAVQERDQEKAEQILKEHLREGLELMCSGNMQEAG